MTSDVYLICVGCNWCHYAGSPSEPAGAHCFRCHGKDFIEVDSAYVCEHVPPGVTLQALAWPLPVAKQSGQAPGSELP